MMNPEVKAKWVAALRSGEYRQGAGYLRQADPDSDGEKEGFFCCLGVLCEIAVQEGVIPEPTSVRRGEDSEEVGWWVYGKHDQFLPREVAAWAGVSVEGDLPDEVVIDGYGYSTLVGPNDEGIPFETIANIIEEVL